MSTYHEKTTTVQDYPNRLDPNPRVESDKVVVVRRPISNGTIAALVITGIVAAALITYLIVSNQQRKQETDLALQQSQQAQSSAMDAQARANNQQQAAPQQPIVVPVPQPQPSQPIVVPTPAPAPAAPATTQSDRAVTTSANNLSLETDVTLKLSDDKELVMYPLTVKASSGIVTLSGAVPTAALRTKAADVAKSVDGVKRVINNIVVQ
jgi:hypothetical protein